MDDIEITITPVKTLAINWMKRDYKTAVDNFKFAGRNFVEDGLHFFNYPSDLSMVYSDEPTDDEKINEARNILKYWRDLEDPDFGYMDFNEEMADVRDMLSKLRIINQRNENSYLRQYLPIIKTLDRYLLTLGYQSNIENVNVRLINIFNHMIKVAKSLSDLDYLTNYIQSYGDLVNANRSRWLDKSKEIWLNCKMWRVEVTHNGFPFGGIMVYHNDLYKLHQEKYLFIQYIALYPIPFLIKAFFKDLTLPSLNGILDEPINRIGIENDCKYIAVHPLDRQGEILKRHYGYKEETDVIILPGMSIEETKSSRPKYSKMVNYD